MLLLFFGAAAAEAAVQVTFYSKELGDSFPHAFVILEGALDRGGPRVDEDYGFTAKAISPAILWGKVGGKVISDHGPAYVKGSDKHFTLTLTDAQYDSLMAAVERWRKLKQPSYDLNRSNCVHFVADLAAAVGLRIDVRKGLIKKPRSFLEALTDLNRDWLTGHGALLYRRPPTPAPAAATP
jgi:hypothetical protein